MKKMIVFALMMCFALPASARESRLSYDSTRTVSAVLSGKRMSYKMPVDSSFYLTMFNEPDYYCHTCSSVVERDSYMLNREDQRERLMSLVNWIKKKKKKQDSRVRIAASLVQKIPYDYDWEEHGDLSSRGHGTRYPYEVLYDNKGICGQKAMFMVFLLKELGYGVATLTFTSPGLHQVAAVKCPPQYDFRDTGYCFIDPNLRHMITFSGSYADSTPEVDVYADGRTFGAKADFQDAEKWWKVLREGTSSSKNYKIFKKLIKKYGM